MNTFQIITRNLVMVCFLTFVSLFSAISKSPSNAEIIKRIENLNTVIELRVTDEVTTQISAYIEKYRKESETILGRTSLYFPMIENSIREKNLPDELKYIAVIESALLPSAVSNQGAAGIWQFMQGTAELFGLKVDKHIDERKDIVKSTDKALDYLKLLYEFYGDWTLALAAYNCGTGTVSKAIKKAKGNTNYWVLQKYLPRETQKYIPKFIAASYLMNYYYVHDLKPLEPSDDIKFTTSVKVFNKTEFKKISKEFAIELNLLKYLNPMYKKDFIPASDDGRYHLTLPDFKMTAYIEKYNSMENLVFNPIAQKRDEDEHQKIAMDNGQKAAIEYVQLLSRKNSAIRDNLKDSSIIAKLKLGLTPGSSSIKLYKLKRKESLTDVAEANNIALNDLMMMNNINEDTGIAPGSIIKLSK
jgi:Transglycosylase SLT domain/LysM domain